MIVGEGAGAASSELAEPAEPPVPARLPVPSELPALPEGFVAPAYGGPSVRAVLPAALAALGVDLHGEAVDACGDLPSPAAVAALGVGPADTVCVVLVDGLGRQMLLERGGHAPYLRAALPGSITLTSGFPSTTATSLGMLGTGLTPGTHGLLGYTVRDPATGDLVNMIGWGGPARPEEWQRCPTLLERATAQGLGVVSVGRDSFRDSGLTRAALRGGGFRTGTSFADRVDAAVRAVRDPATRLVYLYTGEVDTVGHHKGWRSWEWGEETSAVDRELARLVRSVPRGTTVVVTADHGMVDVHHDDKIDVGRTPALAEDVVLVAGEPRAAHVHCVPGRTDAVAARWRDVLGDTAWVLRRDEAERLGLFGRVEGRHRAVIGDLVVAARGTRAVLDSRVQSPPSLGLVGMHGSLTPDEVLVPFVVHAR